MSRNTLKTIRAAQPRACVQEWEWSAKSGWRLSVQNCDAARADWATPHATHLRILTGISWNLSFLETAQSPRTPNDREISRPMKVPFTLGEVGHFGLAVRDPKKS